MMNNFLNKEIHNTDEKINPVNTDEGDFYMNLLNSIRNELEEISNEKKSKINFN